MMDFAKRQLEKYGWSEGKGLGKNLTGIAVALKPKVKLDQCGIGHDIAEEFTYHWWEDAFNSASNNINVANTKDGVKVATVTDSPEISAVKRAQIERDRLKFGSFVKRETMTKSGSVLSPEEKEDPVEKSKSKLLKAPEVLTDEQLFEACGRLTAHKGARHGLTLSGKLQRVKQQEEALLRALQKSSCAIGDKTKVDDAAKLTSGKVSSLSYHCSPIDISEPCEEINKKSKKKKKKRDHENDGQCSENSVESMVKEKKRKKEDVQELPSSSTGGKIKKQKKKNNSDILELLSNSVREGNEESVIENSVEVRRKSKKKRKRDDKEDESYKTERKICKDNSSNEMTCDSETHKIRKIKTSDNMVSEVACESSSTGKKKKHKRKYQD